MRRRQPTARFSSSSDSDESDIESCFDIEDEQEETDNDTEPTDPDTDVEGGGETDLPSCEMGYYLRCFIVLRLEQLMHPDPDREAYIQTDYLR